MAQLIKYSDFSAENLELAALNEKKSKNGKIAFKTSSISYMYEGGKQECLIEGPKMTAARGLTEKEEEEGGRKSFRIVSVINKGDKEQMKFLSMSNALKETIAKWMVENVPDYKKMKSTDTALSAALVALRGLCFDSEDGSATYCMFNCNNFATSKTLFVRPKKIKKMVNGKLQEVSSQEPLSWDLVRNAEITFYPVIRIKDYFAGTFHKIRAELVSAVITDIRACGSVSMQTDTIDKLCSGNPEMLNELEEQIAKLTALRQGILQAGPVVTSSSSSADEKGESSDKKTALASLLGDDEDDTKKSASTDDEDDGDEAPITAKKTSPPKPATKTLKLASKVTKIN